jgi:hypothetical protein
MGFYIEGPATSKAPFIVSEYDGKIIPQPERFEDISADKALICVMNYPNTKDVVVSCFID